MNTKGLLFASVLAAAVPAFAEKDAPVRVATWKGDAKGAVSLYYDDGLDSGFNNVVPELVRRGLPGTFYICCNWFGGDPANPKLARWSVAKEHPDTIFLGDHTWSHGGVTNAAQFAEEIARNGAMLREIAGLPEDEPLSFALPGAVRWDVTREEQDKVLADHHEVLRHDFGGNVGGPKDGQNPTFRMKTAALAIEAFDRAERTGGWESLIFHGVGGDWITFDLEEHNKMLDELEARAKAGRLWVGSAIDVHRYAQARDAVRITGLEIREDGLEFQVEGDMGQQLGLRAPRPTLVCAVPENWKRVRVRALSHVFGSKDLADRARKGFEVPVAGGRLVFDLPLGWVGVEVRKAD